jgi:hypothetical protein
MNPLFRRIFARPNTVTRPSRPKAVRSGRSALLQLTTLEDRANPVTLTVTLPGDSAAGIMDTADPSGNSGDLRYCITRSNTLPSADIIVFDTRASGMFGGFKTPQIISLTSALPTITGDLQIKAPGLIQPLIDPTSWALTVSRIGAANFSIFTVGPGAPVGFFDFKITGGNNDNGGGISVPDATGTGLALTHMEVSGNRTTNGSATPANPGVANPIPGAPTPIGHGGGGGIYMNGPGTLFMTQSTISSNTAFEGGGIFIGNGTAVRVDESVISSNVSGAGAAAASTSGGGGIYFTGAGGTLPNLIVNSTIANNSAGSDGGGILLSAYGGDIELRNSTMSANSSNNLFMGHGGGGIANLGSSTINLYSSILKNNAASNPNTSAPKDILTNGAVNEAFSDVFDLNGGNGTITPNPYAGFSLTTNRNQTDPFLGPLQYNGGPTFSVQPFSNSPIINLGDNSIFPQLPTDQRGPGFVRGSAPGANGSTTPDMGAIEIQPPKVIIITPSTASPTNSNMVNFTVFFNQPVTSLVNTNFTTFGGIQSPTATGTINPNFILVGTPQGIPTTINPSSPFFSWNVPLSSINGDGVVSLNMTNFAGANPNFILQVPFIPTASNPTNPQTGNQYPPSIVIDQTSPTLVAINTNPPSNPPPVPSGPLTWTVSFSENVLGLTPANFGFANQGSATESGAVTVTPVAPLSDGSSDTWTVTTNFTGNGTIGLNMINPTGVKDRAGNDLMGTFPRVGPTYIVGRPIVLSINPTAPATNQNTANFIATFDQPVSGVSVSDFVLVTNNVTANISNVTPATGFNTQYTVSVDIGGLIGSGNGTIQVKMNSSAGTNPVVAEVDPNPPFPGFTGNPITVDFTPPTLLGITELSPITPFGLATNASTVQFGLTFDEAVPAVPQNDLQLIGTAASVASIANVTSTGPNTFTVTVNVPPGVDGTLGLSVTSPAGILDTAGNTLGGIPPAVSDPSPYHVDTIPPTITAITRVDPNPTNAPNAHQLGFTVVFSEPVYGISSSNFSIFESGSGYNGTGILSVTPVGAVPASSYTVTIDTGLEEGTLGIKLANTTNLTDKGGSAVTNVGFQQDTYTVDTIPPSVVPNGFVPLMTSPTTPPSTNQATLSYQITFREPVFGLSKANFLLIADPTISGAAITALSGANGSATYTLTVNTGTGDGLLKLSLANSTGLGDVLLNPVPNLPVNAPDVRVDKTQPLVSAITATDPLVINAPVVRYHVKFTEAITGITPANFSLVTTGLVGANIPPTAVTGSGADYDVTVVTGTGTGTLQLKLSTPAGIFDLAGNPLTIGADGPVYSIDLTAPTVLSITPVGSAATNAATAEFDVHFSGKVSGVTAANFNLSAVGPVGASIIGNPTPNAAGDVWRVTVGTGTGDGTLQVNLTNPAGVVDQAGNTVTGIPAIGQLLTVDKTPPTVTISPAPSQPNPALGEPIRFTVTFSEPVFGFGSGGLALGGTAGAGIATVTGAAGGTTYSVAVTGLSQSGQITAAVISSAASDAAGNASQPSTPAAVNFNRPVPSTPDQYSTQAKTPISVPASEGVLVNDGDAISPARTATLVTAPATNVGSVTLAPDGSFTFTPAPGFSGDAVFTYTASDGVGVSAPTPVTIHVGTHTIRIATSAGAGGGPQVNVLDAQGNIIRSFFAYDPSFTGGVQVAAGDVNGDGVDDIIVGTGVSGGPNVVVFDGVSGAQLFSFFAYEPSFRGGVQVAVGDVNGDGFADIITGTGVSGGPRVEVFSGKDLSLLANFFAFEPAFRGGVNVSAGDVNGDGIADILASPVAGGGPHLVVFQGGGGLNFPIIRSFFAFDPSFTGGVSAAVGDAFGDGTPDIIAATSVGNLVQVFSGPGPSPVATIPIPDPQPTGGLRLATKDTNNDGLADVLLMATGPGDMPRIIRFNLSTMTRIDELLDFPQSFTGGIYVG